MACNSIRATGKAFNLLLLWVIKSLGSSIGLAGYVTLHTEYRSTTKPISLFPTLSH